MRKLILASVLVTLGGTAWAQQAGQFGAGVVVGDPTGVTAKYWIDPAFAVDGGVGFSGDAAFYADLLWHTWDLLPQPQKGKLGAYVGFGPRVETDRDTTLGLRTLAGVNYWVPNHPVEIFLDAGPVFNLSPNRGVDVDAGLGVRFYFASAKSK